jgi:uncharacterized protein (TIGR02271 family)
MAEYVDVEDKHMMNEPRGSATLHEGWDVYSSDDHKVGTIMEAYDDYIVVEKGWLFKKDLYIPTSAVQTSDPDGRTVYLNVYKDQIDGLAWDTAPMAGHSTATADMGTTDTIKLREEELGASKERVQAGEVEIGKRVVTEQRSMDVPVTHEEVSIERRPVERHAAEGDIDDAGRESIHVPLMEERVDVEKRPVVTEEVAVHKRPVTETERVDATVRREEAVVKGDHATTAAGTGHTHEFVGGRCACGYTE